MGRRESSVTFTVRCEQEQKEAWEKAAKAQGLSRNAWVVQQLEVGKT